MGNFCFSFLGEVVNLTIMQIANPIYDVVFRYLLEDKKIAKLLISSIIDEEIEDLDFSYNEFTSESIAEKLKEKTASAYSFTVYRLDFKAKIRTEEGYRIVLIEIQKAKFATDIMRFRTYLGSQYSDKENTQEVSIKGHPRKVGLPIISIYFLGHKLDHTEASVIHVRRDIRDLVTGEKIEKKESFIESLSHDSYIVQIPSLSQKRRNELETLLSIFDQSTAIDREHHILSIREESYPEKYHSLIRQLHKAIEEPEVRKKMDIEDSILDEMTEQQRRIETLSEKVEKERQAKEQALKQNEALLQEIERLKKLMDH